MMRASHRQKGFVAAVAHRLSGLALALFLPVHFLALGTALDGADALESFFAATNRPDVKLAELGLVVALATHMALGLRVLAIEFLDFRERTLAVLATCFALVVAAGLTFALNAR
jgi:fumarate reductase subunit D